MSIRLYIHTYICIEGEYRAPVFTVHAPRPRREDTSAENSEETRGILSGERLEVKAIALWHEKVASYFYWHACGKSYDLEKRLLSVT